MADPGDAASTDAQQTADAGKGSISNIDIFLRVRPVNKPSPRVLLDSGEGKVEFVIPREASAGLVNNSREHYEFKFNGILAADAKQDEVFERVARPVVVGAMEGFNGTIFAYGQTGSGKTFTITGGAERYVDRGIIPRSISCIFSEAAKRGDYSFQVHITYLEIYNEMSYDLLDPNREVKALEDLPQVHIMEDEEQRIHFRNLTIHRAGNEEDALNLLFLGDTNRTIAETPMNMASSRSHCIFTIHIEARKAGEDTVRRSKLHLVDLAGSERAHKSGIDGATLREAKYINLSLHYLEQVIVALQERALGLSRSHVPYRNSVMTTVLRDSLGGNCRTVMVATINSQQDQLEESISTCRFAQRVAMVRNEVAVNEEVDPTALIRRLRAEVRELKEEVRLLKGGAPERGPLTADEKERLAAQVAAFCAESGPDAGPIPGAGDMMLIRACYDIFRQMVQKAGGTPATSIHSEPSSGASTDAASSSGHSAGTEAQEQLKKLRLQVAQRDNEINILVAMLRRREAAGPAGAPQGLLSALPSSSGTSGRTDAALTGTHGALASSGTSYSGYEVVASRDGASGPASTSAPSDLSALLNTNLLADRNKAFEVFRKSYRQNEVIEENKALLKQKYDAAKALGASVNASKERINTLKTQIEQRRVQRSMAGDSTGTDPEEEHAKELIEKEKASYKEAFTQLRDLKVEVEHLHKLLENSRQRLQADFRQWLALMTQQQQQHQQQQQQGHGTRPGSRGGPAKALQHATAGATPDMQASWGSGMGAPGSLRAHSTASSVGRGGSGTPSTLAAASEASMASMAGASTAAQLDVGSVDPAVLAAARPHLTGNPAADADIIRFYDARAKLLHKLGQQV